MTLTKADVERILRERFKEGFFKLKELPQPATFKDMERGARRIVQAIQRQERIAIVGDYDVDGVVATALMEEFFDHIGYPIQVAIPNRFHDGYGLSPAIIERLEADLIITVDNGIGAHEAAAYCAQQGIDLIITDHHTPAATLPEAYAIINPKQDGCSFRHKEICGAQVAWFLIGQLKRELGLQLHMGSLLDLLALAIVADIMPLRHINRPLLQAGLRAMEQSQRPAISFLRSILKKRSFTSEDLAFGIAPVLNSAGRMADASLALAFLRSKSHLEASIHYSKLLALNSQRKAEERRVFQESLEFVDERRVIVSVGEDWNQGVVGIVAAQLADRFKRPAIVLTQTHEGHLKGSGRSVGDVDLYHLLDGSRDLLLGFGGHKKAAGLSLEAANLEALRTRLHHLAANLPQEAFESEEEILGELPLTQVDWELIKILDTFAPYGESNPMPKFLAKGVEVLNWRNVGEQGEHLLLTLRQGGATFRGIWFRSSKIPGKERIDIVYYPARNEFNETMTIQLFITQILE